jgi:GGDEF domain-containing protein
MPRARRTQFLLIGLLNSASSRGQVTVSVGLSTKTNTTRDDGMLVGEADLALYEAKRLGRNRSFASWSLKRAHDESGPLQFTFEP